MQFPCFSPRHLSVPLHRFTMQCFSIAVHLPSMQFLCSTAPYATTLLRYASFLIHAFPRPYSASPFNTTPWLLNEYPCHSSAGQYDSSPYRAVPLLISSIPYFSVAMQNIPLLAFPLRLNTMLNLAIALQNSACLYFSFTAQHSTLRNSTCPCRSLSSLFDAVPFLHTAQPCYSFASLHCAILNRSIAFLSCSMLCHRSSTPYISGLSYSLATLNHAPPFRCYLSEISVQSNLPLPELCH